MTEITKIELVDLARVRSVGTASTTSDITNIRYYKLQKQLGFVDPNGSALSADTTVTLWYYRKPLSDGTETISDSIEPIIDDRWDDYLVFRAAFELTGKPEFLALAQQEMQRVAVLQLAQVNRSYQVPVNRDYD